MSAPTAESVGTDIESAVLSLATAAKAASRSLNGLTTATKNEVLLAAAEAIEANTESILAANASDVERAEAGGTEASLIDRLRLTADRVKGIAGGLRQVAALADPIGRSSPARPCPTGWSCGSCGCRSAWSASCTRRAPTSPSTPSVSPSSPAMQCCCAGRHRRPVRTPNSSVSCGSAGGQGRQRRRRGLAAQ